MLIRFTVSNFRSFSQEECFSMEAGKTRNFSSRIKHLSNAKILKFKAIYGANASGKSNLIKAIDVMQQAVLRGLSSDTASDYCRMSEQNSSIPSKFEMEILLENIRYVYGFEVLLNACTFTKEWLKERKGVKYRDVFYRDVTSGTYNVSSYLRDSSINERLSIYADDIVKDGTILFLHVMNQNKDTLYGESSKINVYRMIYRWFRNKLSVNHPDEPITKYTYFFDSKGSAKAEELLQRLDTGISKVQVCDESTEKVMGQFPKKFYQDIQDALNEQKTRNEKQRINDTPAIMIRSHEGHSMYILELKDDEIRCKTLKFNHQHSSSLFSLQEESDGTIRLLDLLEILLSSASNMVYVIDEINRCMHPLLTRKYIKEFLDLAVNRDIQLIATTHEADLMDLDLLRQDEIGFIGKCDTDGTSKVFGLDEFGARFDKRIRRAYLEGQYGAVPNLMRDKVNVGILPEQNLSLEVSCKEEDNPSAYPSDS